MVAGASCFSYIGDRHFRLLWYRNRIPNLHVICIRNYMWIHIRKISSYAKSLSLISPRGARTRGERPCNFFFCTSDPLDHSLAREDPHLFPKCPRLGVSSKKLYRSDTYRSGHSSSILEHFPDGSQSLTWHSPRSVSWWLKVRVSGIPYGWPVVWLKCMAVFEYRCMINYGMINEKCTNGKVSALPYQPTE